jgi:hypothetical protein
VSPQCCWLTLRLSVDRWRAIILILSNIADSYTNSKYAGLRFASHTSKQHLKKPGKQGGEG